MFWKDNQHQFPALAALAQDILSVPATGAGVERLFNTAHDICHYHQGRLNSSTIQELMIFLCTLNFDIQEEQLIFLKNFLSQNKIKALKEEQEATPDPIELEPISNQEEDKKYNKQTNIVEASETDLSLPTEEGMSQVRASVRACKRTRREDEFIYY